jgi:hypothetical protein
MLRLPFSDRVAPRMMCGRDREFIATTGVMVIVAGCFTAADPTARHEVFLGSLLPFLWALSGGVTVAYALRPWSSDLHALSRAALTTSALSRSFQLGISVILGDVPSDRILRTLGGVVVYALLARLFYRQWMTLMPIPEDRRAPRR